MLKVTIEIVPFGIEAAKRKLGVLSISNDGKGNSLIGNYKLRYADEETIREDSYVGYDRAKGFLPLVIESLLKFTGPVR